MLALDLFNYRQNSPHKTCRVAARILLFRDGELVDNVAAYNLEVDDCHAERHALAKYRRLDGNYDHATLICTHPPCIACALALRRTKLIDQIAIIKGAHWRELGLRYLLKAAVGRVILIGRNVKLIKIVERRAPLAY